MSAPESVANPRMFSPLSTAFPIKEQKPAGSPWNPLHWPSWFTFQKNRLNLPNPGKFERLHFEVKGKGKTKTTATAKQLT